jgi:hypothetical protein
MKHLLYELKQPFIKADMKRFITEGLLASLIFGGFIGALDFILENYFDSILAIFTYLILYFFLSNRLFRSFNQYHIWYSILAVVFLLMAEYAMGLTAYLLVIQIITGNASVVFGDFRTAISVLNPLIYFSYFWVWSLSFRVIFSNLLQILFTIYFCFSIYRMMKR